jgi:uncharacterized protein (DUF433 family)
MAKPIPSKKMTSDAVLMKLLICRLYLKRIKCEFIIIKSLLTTPLGGLNCMPAAAKKTKHPYIVFTGTHCGGSPIIAGTKFPVKSIVFYILKQGMAPEELVKEFTHLTLPQIYDALSYYYEHVEEIEKELDFSEIDLQG